jgi:soluble lytic murein transglycosylase-like protein
MRIRALLLSVLIVLLLPAVAFANYPHVVQSGETLTSVAALDGLSVDAIASANGISNQSQLVAGQVLWIPPRSFATASAGAAATAVTSGTTTNGGTTASSVSQADPDSDSDTDTASTETATATHPSTQTQGTTATQTQTVVATQSSPAPGQTAAPGATVPVPTAERASAAEIASIAAANGVPAAFAEAISWQESGWNNDEVSGVGAVGVMQIVPGTWSWIDQYLTPSNPLGTASVGENIRAGVLLLHQLLSLTGGNEQLAAAGYFQGLSSVQAHGMYASTRQYVADVMALTQRFGG